MIVCELIMKTYREINDDKLVIFVSKRHFKNILEELKEDEEVEAILGE